MTTRTRVAVLGGGSWGTALGGLLARGGHDTILWCRDPALAERLRSERTNDRYLPGIVLPESLRVTSQLDEAVRSAEVVVGAVPSGATGSVATAAARSAVPEATWLSATKGLEIVGHRRMSEVVRASGWVGSLAVLSGPSFALEVAQGQPTAVVVAGEDLAVARRLQEIVSGPAFRAYASRDVVGVELGGAVKNVIAIAAGLVSGLGLGSNPLSALVTRGLHEMTGLAVRVGAEPRTLGGLAGLGDLVLTCTGSLSRNRRLGEAIARGQSVEAARAALGQVAEGVETTARVLELAAEQGVEMPITEAVRDVLFHATPPREAVSRLMGRTLRDEIA